MTIEFNTAVADTKAKNCSSLPFRLFMNNKVVEAKAALNPQIVKYRN